MPPARAALPGGGAVALAGIVLAAMTLRTAVTSLTPLLDFLGRTFGFGAVMAGVFGMVPTAAFAVFGVLTPSIAHRLGLERTVLLSMLVSAAGLIGRSASGGTWELLAGSVVALCGMGIGNVVLPPLVKRYFPDRVGAVSTAYIAVLQLGTILPALVTVPFTAAAGWRVSLGSWALLSLAAAVPWIVVLRATGGHPVPAPAGAPPGDEAPELAPPGPAARRVWHSPLAWGMTLVFGTTSLIVYSMFTWLPKLLVEAGATPAAGGAMVAVFSILGLTGALVVPSLTVRLSTPFPLVAGAAAAFAAGLAGLHWAPMTATWLWVALVGTGPATFPMTLTLINLRTRTPQGSAALSGFMQGVGYTVSCAGPLLLGVIRERTGGWGVPLAALAACLLPLLVGGWLVSRPRLLEDGG